jgi:hypothetical protein
MVAEHQSRRVVRGVSSEMSAQYRNLVEALARSVAARNATDVLGKAMEDAGYCHEDDGPMNAEGFLDMHRRDVRVVLSELIAMGRLK